MKVLGFSGNAWVTHTRGRNRHREGDAFPRDGQFTCTGIQGNNAGVFVLVAFENGPSYPSPFYYIIDFFPDFASASAAQNAMLSFGTGDPASGWIGESWNIYFRQFVGDKMTSAQYAAWVAGSQSYADAVATLYGPRLPK